jgi:hypothetical protein
MSTHATTDHSRDHARACLWGTHATTHASAGDRECPLKIREIPGQEHPRDHARTTTRVCGHQSRFHTPLKGCERECSEKKKNLRVVEPTNWSMK